MLLRQLSGSSYAERASLEKEVGLTVSADKMNVKSAFGIFPPSIAGAGAMAARGRRAPATMDRQYSVEID